MPNGGKDRAGMRPQSREVSPEKGLSAGDERLEPRSGSLNHTTDVHQDVSLNQGSVLRTEPLVTTPFKTDASTSVGSGNFQLPLQSRPPGEPQRFLISKKVFLLQVSPGLTRFS